MTRRFSRTLAMVLVGASAACADSVLGPRPGSVYILERSNGEPLPAILVLTQFSTRYLVADSLVFRDDDRFERVRWTRDEARGTGIVTIEREHSTGRMIVAGRAFTLVDDVCLDADSLALCTAPDTARLMGGTLTLDGPVPPAGHKEFQIVH